MARFDVPCGGALLALCLVLAAPAAAQTSGWQTYSDPVRRFTIDYPPGWTVDPNFIDKGYGFYQGDTDDMRRGVALKPLGDLAPGSNLESDQLALVVQWARPGDLCTASAFLVDPPPDYATERPLEKPDIVRTIAEPGDLYTVEQAVILVGKAPCTAVHYYVNYGRERRGDARPHFNHETLFGLMNAIAATYKPLK
ncbi:MAG TPA: hypothetical protein VGB91_07955 [Rhizomicrobium sp.]